MSTIDALTCPECGLGQNAHMYNCSRNPFGSEIDALKRTAAAQTSGLNLPRTESAVNHSESASVAALQEIDQLRAERDAPAIRELMERERVAIASWDEERQRAEREGARVVALAAQLATALAEVDRLNHWQENYANEMQEKLDAAIEERDTALTNHHDYVMDLRAERDAALAGAVAVQETALTALRTRHAQYQKHWSESQGNRAGAYGIREAIEIIEAINIDPIRAGRELLDADPRSAEELDELTTDALRYRWLRQRGNSWQVRRFDSGWFVLMTNRLDAAIDAARTGGNKT